MTRAPDQKPPMTIEQRAAWFSRYAEVLALTTSTAEQKIILMQIITEAKLALGEISAGRNRVRVLSIQDATPERRV